MFGLWQRSKWPRRRSATAQRQGLALALAALLGSVAAVKGQFKASLDRDSVVVGEIVTLSLRFENTQPSGIPAIPAVPGLQVAGPRGSSSEQRVENGRMTSSTTYTVPLAAQQAGDFVIPAMTADVGGQKVQSQPLRLKVLQSDPSAPPPQNGEKLAFLWPVLAKKELFVGEILVAEMRLYVRGDVHHITDVQIPPLRGDGFTSGKFAEGQRFQRKVGNAQFTVIPILAAITPLKGGDLVLGPVNGSVVVHLPMAGRRQINPFDIDSFFGPSTQAQQVPLGVEAQTLHVMPLPGENVPPGFTGAIGNYTMTFSAGPTNVATGDPITVKVQISGRGYLDAISLGEQAAWKDFKTYPPTTKTETTDQLGVQGTKYFEQLVTPQSSDVKELPGISFSYFDPDAKVYRTLAQPAVKLSVRPGGTTAAPTVAVSRNNAENPPPTQDIVPIKQRFGMMAQAQAPLLTQPWFLGLQSVPVLAFVCAFLWRRSRENLANNPRLRRQRMVAVIMRNGLEQLRRFAAEKNSDEFFAALFRLLQEQIGERLDLPASAITEAVVEDELRPRGVPEQTLAAVQELFQICNLARYAPLKTSQELAAVIPKFEEAVRGLQEVKG
jgi:hypothetical protein